MDRKTLDKRVGPLQWARLNCKNLILDQESAGLLERAARVEDAKQAVLPTEDSSIRVKLLEKERERRLREDAAERAKQEVDYKVCIEKANERRRLIDQAKEIINGNSHENKLLKRALFLTEMLHQNKEDIEESRRLEEETKKRNVMMELKFMEGELMKDKERQVNAKELRMKINEDNMKLIQINTEKKEQFREQDKKHHMEIIQLSKEFEQEQKKRKIKDNDQRQKIDEDNNRELERKEMLRLNNVKLEEMEERDSELFLEAKKEMYKSIGRDVKSQIELQEKQLDMVVNKTKEWIQDLDPEGIRDKWYRDIYSREVKVKEGDELVRVQKKKKELKSLVEFWKQQVDLKEDQKCRKILDDKMCFEVRVQMDCQMKKEDEDRKRFIISKRSEDTVFNRNMESAKKQAGLHEKLNDKERIEKLYEWIKAQGRKNEEKRNCLIARCKEQGIDAAPLEHLKF